MPRRTTLSQDAIWARCWRCGRIAPRDGQTGRRSDRCIVPARLLVRVEGAQAARRSTCRASSGLAARRVVGDVRVTGIAGAVTGSHSATATLTIADAAAVDPDARQTRTPRFERHARRVTLTTRNGHCRITGAGGRGRARRTNDEIIVDASPPARCASAARGGTVAIDDPGDAVHDRRAAHERRRDARARGRRSRVLTTDEPLRLLLGEHARRSRSTRSRPTAARSTRRSLGVAPERINEETRVRHTVGSGARSRSRSEIVAATIVISRSASDRLPLLREPLDERQSSSKPISPVSRSRVAAKSATSTISATTC